MRDNPFGNPGRWLKVAIHVHTTNSDGMVTPAQALEVYASCGYDAVVFGDHWHVTTGAGPCGRALVIPGAEYDARFPDGLAGMHFMAVGMSAGADDALKGLRDDPYAMARALAGLCDYLVLAHPYWSALTTELIAATPAIGALEVYNHGCEVEDELGRAMYVWDQLLARGGRWDAIAVDDAHWRRDDDHCGGWVMVRAESNTPEAIVAALKAGQFYSSSGPEIRDVEFLAPRRLSVRTSPAGGILFRCNGSLGSGLHSGAAAAPITQAEHELPDRARFVRIEVTDHAGRKAWTNPFYFDR